MKKNSFLWILVALVVFFFVFGMGKSVYEGFGCSPAGQRCKNPATITVGGIPYKSICGKTGKCSPTTEKA
jgi:hypothetical protein